MHLFTTLTYSVTADCGVTVGALLLDTETGRYSLRFIGADEELSSLEAIRNIVDVDYIYNYIALMAVEALDIFQCYLLLTDDLQYAYRELRRNLVFNVTINELESIGNDTDLWTNSVFDKYAEEIYNISVQPRKRSPVGDSDCVPPTANSEAIEM